MDEPGGYEIVEPDKYVRDQLDQGPNLNRLADYFGLPPKSRSDESMATPAEESARVCGDHDYCGCSDSYGLALDKRDRFPSLTQ